MSENRRGIFFTHTVYDCIYYELISWLLGSMRLVTLEGSAQGRVMRHYLSPDMGVPRRQPHRRQA